MYLLFGQLSSQLYNSQSAQEPSFSLVVIFDASYHLDTHYATKETQ